VAAPASLKRVIIEHGKKSKGHTEERDNINALVVPRERDGMVLHARGPAKVAEDKDTSG
jgi:hypothetical protein